MTRDQAKRILSLYRPWASDAEDDAFAKALAMAETDPEIKEWFARHSAMQSAIREQFVRIHVPDAFKEQIISEHRAELVLARRRKFLLPAALVAILVSMALIGNWVWKHTTTTNDLSYDAYRMRMLKTALRTYGMDLETHDPKEIRSYLEKHQARADYQLPTALASATYTGCGVLSWQGHRVSMVCFHSGRPLPPGEKTDLFLFVIADKAAEGSPNTQKPNLLHTNDTATASWNQDGLVYLLATTGDESLLKRYLNENH
ncbi:MAG: hypothetical protein RLY20_2831 [Verrucomicrobiota bacterium]|jgi:hypothetical protein